MAGHVSHSTDEHAVSGTIEFASGTRLQIGNLHLPMYLELADRRWVKVFLPGEPPNATVYDIANGSALIDAPNWTKNVQP